MSEYGDHIMQGEDGAAVPGLRIATVTLTDAQIKALPTTAVTFGTAPGAGFFNRVIACTYNFDTDAGAYTNINAAASALAIIGSTLVFGPINNTTAVPNINTLSTLLGTTGKRIHCPLVPYSEGYAYAGSADFVLSPIYDTHGAVEDLAFSIQLDNGGSGNLTGGNAANTLKVRLYYFVEPLV